MSGRPISQLAPDPPLNYLSYKPRNRRYHLDVAWGYLSMNSNVGCVFYISDTDTGDTVERSKGFYRLKAEGEALVWRERVQRLNKLEHDVHAS